MDTIILTNTEKEIVYFTLSRLLDDNTISHEEFNSIDCLRDCFKTSKLLKG